MQLAGKEAFEKDRSLWEKAVLAWAGEEPKKAGEDA